jgi:AcrR family transcriptional regulator
MEIERPGLPRIKSGAATKQAILVAARKRLLQESFEDVRLRKIASDVGVDVALISRYFGSKEGLFREVLHDRSIKEILPDGLGLRDMPSYLANLFLSQDYHENENVERLLIIIRSASSPAASKLVSEAMRSDILIPFAQRLGGNNAKIRASTSMAVWMGMAIMHKIFMVDSKCNWTPEIADRLQALFRAALSDVPA